LIHKIKNTPVSSGKSYAIYGKPWHSINIFMWCTLSWTQITGPVFFDCPVNTGVYLTIFSEYVNQLTDEGPTTGDFQQHGSRCHTSNASNDGC
jgi:hypothetical protein